MKPPSKFQLMRQNRESHEWRARDTTPYIQAVKAGVTAERLLAASIETVMELDGVKYREAPEPKGGLNGDCCRGCAFDNDIDSCDRGSRMGRAAFGISCGSNRTIYIRAEA